MELVSLSQWAQSHGRSADAVQNHWTRKADFPAVKDTRRLSDWGAPTNMYDPAELDDFAANLEQQHRREPSPMPPEPEKFRTLGAIAKLIEVDGKTLTALRAEIEKAEVPFEETPTGRRRYRTAGVVEVFNERNQRRGRAAPRKAPDDTPSAEG